jgi:hypothetical protein
VACTTTAACASSGHWPQWRGPDRTDVSKETGLLKTWPEGGPKRVWLFSDAGLGYAGHSIVGGKLFTMGLRNGGEELIALDAQEGKELWAAKIGEIFKNDRGDGPRSTPTVDGDHVYAMGGRGNLICANVSDGKVVWQRTMKELGGRTPGWGYSESVLVDGNHVIYQNDEFIVFLNKYPMLYGYLLVAPIPHKEQVTGDFTLEEYLSLQRAVYRVAEAVRRTVEKGQVPGRGAERCERRMEFLDIAGIVATGRCDHQHVRPFFRGLVEQIFLERKVLRIADEAAAADRNDVRHRPG